VFSFRRRVDESFFILFPLYSTAFATKQAILSGHTLARFSPTPSSFQWQPLHRSFDSLPGFGSGSLGFLHVLALPSPPVLFHEFLLLRQLFFSFTIQNASLSSVWRLVSLHAILS